MSLLTLCYATQAAACVLHEADPWPGEPPWAQPGEWAPRDAEPAYEPADAPRPGRVNFLAPVFDGREATLLGDAVAPENAAMASLDTLLSDCLRDAAWTRTTCLGQWQQQAIGMPDEALLRACIQRIARECPPDTTIIAPLPTPGSSVAAEPLGPRSPARVPPWLWPTVCWGLGVCGTVIALILVQIVHTHRAERRSNSLFP